ncbi:MAG TPA: LuxR C-terminal-related transcriptional regulator [Steroidobacteraceae bacterium]|nr:LuxR C-terminal-related transcriptional regulator [Steroidobacteraceae bacterium]
MTGKRHERVIIQGKLYPDTGARKPLPRPRLDSSSDVLDGIFPVIVVAAPAGYGKSTLMARWHARLRERGVSCAWLSLDEDDNDAARFLQHLIAALQKASSHIGKGVAEDLISDFASGSRSVLEAIAGDLMQVQHRIVLFLDDLHLVEGPEVRGILDWLINYASRHLQYVIGTRQDPGLRLSGLRVRCQLLELGAEQLQFDAAETAQFYKNRLGRDLPVSDLQTLLTKTEGWPAALELAALVLAGSSEPAAFIQHFAGTDTSMVDYLGDMVLSQMDERTRDIVFRISMFDRICAPLAQAVTDARDAEEALLGLRTRNLFLIPLDRSWTWVRFHHLVGEFFRETYRRTEPAQARECLVRGAKWLHANAYAEEAVNYMIRAQEWEQATRWVADSVEELVFRRGYHQTILRWMNALPEAYVDRYPVIRIQYAFSLSFYPRYQEYEAQIYRLQQLLRTLEVQPHQDAHGIDELRCAVEMQVAMSVGLRDDGMRGGDLAAAWLARWPEASLRRKGVMGNVLSFGRMTRGHIDQGLEMIAQTRQWLERSEGYYALSWTAYLEAVLHLKRGSYFDARLACTLGLELVERKLHGHPGQASMLLTLLAGIAYEFDEVERALAHLEMAQSSVNEYAHADAVIVAYLTQARIQHLRQDESGALAMLREGQELGEQRGWRRVTLSLAAEECRNLARAGHYEEARLVATRFEFHELPPRGGAPSLSSDKAVRAASRYLLKQSPGVVVEALDAAIENSQQRELAHRSVELLILRALAKKENEDWASALADVRLALTIAAPRNFLRVFLDEGHELGALIDRLDMEQLRGSEAAPLARRLQRAMRGPDAQGGAPIGLGEELTKRELSILKRLETGLSNKEIAEAIFVSEGTLKWHLHNVYGKLNVKNRTGAMTRARALGIL